MEEAELQQFFVHRLKALGLTPGEAARRAGIDKKTVWRWTKGSGLAIHLKMERFYRVLETERIAKRIAKGRTSAVAARADRSR